MKIKLISLLIILLSLTTLRSQDFWQQINGPSGGYINKIFSAPNGMIYAISNSAVFKSTNEGVSWSQMTPPSLINITAGGAAPNGNIYVTTGNFTSKIFRSTNQGASWDEILPDGGYEFKDMTITPGGIVLAGTFYMFSFHGQFIQSGEIYRSTNNGATFTNAFFPDLAIASLSANTNGDIYVATISGLFKSANGGASWGLIRNDTCARVFTSSAGHVFLLARGLVHRSTNHGSSWEQVSTKMPMASNPEGTLFAAEGGKVYKSLNNGSSWQELATISNAPLFDIYSIHTIGNTKIFTGSDLGVHKSVNSGSTWEDANNGIRVPNIKTIAARGNIIFAGSDRYTSRSTDNGNTWVNLINGLPDFGAYKIKINTNGTVIAFVNSTGVYRSADNGNSWSKITALTGDANSGNIDVNSNSDIFIAGNENVYKSTDNGASWVTINNGLPTDQPGITGISVDKQNNVYTSVQWGGFNTQYGVFKSTNGGANWARINEDPITAKFKFTSNNNIFCITGTRLMRSTNGGVSFSIVPSAPDYCIELEIGAQDQIFLHYVFNEVYGIKRSSNNGTTWSEFTQGLGQLLVYDFEFDNNSYLLAATQSGLFKTVNSTLGITSHNSETPSDYSLSQNYPNPFNPGTVIKFSIPENKYTNLTVYNSIGEEIAVLINEVLNSGTYEYSWDASGFSSGIYFYKLESGSYSQTRKMTLIK